MNYLNWKKAIKKLYDSIASNITRALTRTHLAYSLLLLVLRLFFR